jgi:TDG/mug DNA glycosylase family protein
MRTTLKPWKPTKRDLAEASGKRVADIIAPKLRILFVGINPGLYSAAVSHHFARPGNRFWPAVFQAGFTDRLLSPFEERELLARRLGITNLVGRASAHAEELTKEELVSGARRLKRKIRRYRPTCVAFLGITAYRAAFDRPRAPCGPQRERIGKSMVWVLPNPSGLNAHHQLNDLARMFKELKDTVVSM